METVSYLSNWRQSEAFVSPVRESEKRRQTPKVISQLCLFAVSEKDHALPVPAVPLPRGLCGRTNIDELDNCMLSAVFLFLCAAKNSACLQCNCSCSGVIQRKSGRVYNHIHSGCLVDHRE